MMNRKVYIFISFLMIGISYAADVPIIFVHGHKSEGDTTAGFKTWNPPDYTSVMEKILNQHYQGYKPGIPLNCDKNTVLQPMNTTKVIYNFSYYSPDGSPGVISLIGEGASSEQKEKEKVEIPFWKKLSFSIGYSGGICWSGDDLMKKPSSIMPWDLIGARLYWLNSIEGSVIYPFNEKWGIEFGGGFGWTDIKIHSSLSYRFKLLIMKVGFRKGKHLFGLSYIYGNVNKITGGIKEYIYKGKGKGIKFLYLFNINKFIALEFNAGEIPYIIYQEEKIYKIYQSLYSITFVIGYNSIIRKEVQNER